METLYEFGQKCLETWAPHENDYCEKRARAGMIEELGEIIGKWKKWKRGDYNKAEYDKLVLPELGDFLYYLTIFLYYYHFDLKMFDLRKNISSYIKINKGFCVLNEVEILQSHLVALLADKLTFSSSADDVFRCLELIANYSGHTLSDVAKANVAKLADRAKRNTICGSGDDR